MKQIECSSVSSFSWEEVAVHSRGVSGFRLLAVGAQCDLKLLEAEAERSASISLLSVCECPADRLLQTVREQDDGEYHHQPTTTTIIIIIIMCRHSDLTLQQQTDRGR